MKTNGISPWLKDNAWNIITTLVLVVMAFAALNSRVVALEVKIKEYPSQDWFELKFEVLEKKITELELELKEHSKFVQIENNN